MAIASLIPGVDTIADLVSIPIDLIRGDYVSAILSAIGAIPVVGEVADTAKIAKTADKIFDAAKGADNAIDAAKAIDNATDAAKLADVSKGIKNISPSMLTQTHTLTLSKKQYGDLVDSIRKNGIIEPIKYVEYNGTKYVVDGHHRLRAAKELGLEKIPTEKVSLPYKGYQTINDLLWFD